MSTVPSLGSVAASFDEVGQRLTSRGVAGGNAFDVLAGVAVAVVAGAQWASITQVWQGQCSTVGRSDVWAERADAVQYELGSGPCVDAATQDAVFRVDDLRTDSRWPQFGARVVAETGVLSVLSYRLHLESTQLTAALNVYATAPRAFDDAAQLTGLLVATHGAQMVTAARASEPLTDVRVMLEGSRRVRIACGVLRHRHQVSSTQAMHLLRVGSQFASRDVDDVAAAITAGGALSVAR